MFHANGSMEVDYSCTELHSIEHFIRAHCGDCSIRIPHKICVAEKSQDRPSHGL